MSIRKMKLKDYGITPGRAAELKEMVKDKQYYSLMMEHQHYSDVLLSGEAGETAQNTRQVSLESLR